MLRKDPTIRIWIDMDETMFDFSGAIKETREYNPPEMYEPGFFENLEPLPGALKYVQKIYQMEGVEVGILTKPVAISPNSYTEKVRSILKHFPYLVFNIILTQDKSVIKGDIFIDDTRYDFDGTFIRFDANAEEPGYSEWYRVFCEVEEIVAERQKEKAKRDAAPSVQKPNVCRTCAHPIGGTYETLCKYCKAIEERTGI